MLQNLIGSTNYLSNKIFSFLKNRYILAFGVVVLWDFFYNENYIFNTLVAGDYIFGIGRYTISYIIALIVLSIINKIFSSNYVNKNEEITTSIQNLIDDSTEFLYIISPFLDLGNLLIEKLIKKSSEGIEIKIIHNTSEINQNRFVEFYNRLRNTNIKFINNPNLHAKVYYNEREVIVASMNLTSSSMKNSFEIAMYSDYSKVRKDIEYFIEEITSSDMSNETKIDQAQIEMGFCIKTRSQIPLNPFRPVAKHIYLADKSPSGSYCHKCGEKYETTISNPFCSKHSNVVKNIAV